MKRRLLLLLSALFMLAAPIAVMSPAQAAVDPFQDVCEDAQTDGQNPVCDRSGNDNPISGEDGVILRVVRIVSFVIGVAAVLMLMLGGLKYITANGDPNSISSAKNTIIYALIGLALAAFSQAIVIFVLSRL